MRVTATLFLMLTMQAQAGELKLEIFGKDLAGQEVRVGVYNTNDHFGEEAHYFKGMIATATGDSVTVTFPDLPAGKYAAGAYADSNRNGKHDTFLGKPLELYGFTKDARGMFSPPDFSDAAFDVSAGTVTQSIHLQ